MSAPNIIGRTIFTALLKIFFTTFGTIFNCFIYLCNIATEQDAAWLSFFEQQQTGTGYFAVT